MRVSEIVRQKLTADEFGRLSKFVVLLDKWRKVTNLIADDSFANIWERHILDSMFLQQCEPDAQTWLDIGSGAGLPAVVLATVIAGKHHARVHCVEIDRRKCAFLREVAAQLSLPMKIHNSLAEDVGISDAPRVEVVTARAFSSLQRIVGLAAPFLATGAVVVVPRGHRGQDEVAALDCERYSVLVTPNPAPGDGVFIRIQQRAPHLHERRQN